MVTSYDSGANWPLTFPVLCYDLKPTYPVALDGGWWSRRRGPTLHALRTATHRYTGLVNYTHHGAGPGTFERHPSGQCTTYTSLYFDRLSTETVSKGSTRFSTSNPASFFFSFLLRNSILRHNSADKLFLHKEISYLSGTSCPRDSVHWRDYQLLGHPRLPASKSRLPRVLSLSLLLGISQTASLDQPREISTTEVRKEDMTTILNGQAPPASTPQTDMRDWKTMSVYFYNLLS